MSSPRIRTSGLYRLADDKTVNQIVHTFALCPYILSGVVEAIVDGTFGALAGSLNSV
jgi:hypothetical protein